MPTEVGHALACPPASGSCRLMAKRTQLAGVYWEPIRQGANWPFLQQLMVAVSVLPKFGYYTVDPDPRFGREIVELGSAWRAPGKPGSVLFRPVADRAKRTAGSGAILRATAPWRSRPRQFALA